MDILLRNVDIEKPESGIECKFNSHGCCMFHRNEKICSAAKGVPEECPMIFLGEHGDLLDRDVILAERFDRNTFALGYDLSDVEEFLERINICVPSNKIDPDDDVLRLCRRD